MSVESWVWLFFNILHFSYNLTSFRMAELCTPTLFVPTPPTLERSHASLTWSWTWAVEWSRTQWPRLCTLSIIVITAALQAQADSIPAWTSTHPAASTIRCVWVVKGWLFVQNVSLAHHSDVLHILSGDSSSIRGDTQPEPVCPSGPKEGWQHPGPLSWHVCGLTITPWFPVQSLLPCP